jgi:hypothetical protein
VARTETKLTRKDLRQPDEFQTLSRQALAFVEENRTAVITALGAVILVLLGVVAVSDGQPEPRGERLRRLRRGSRAPHQQEVRRRPPTKFNDGRQCYSGTSYGPLALLERGNALLLGDQACRRPRPYERFLQSSPPTDYLRQLAIRVSATLRRS